jgi:hypothetical protein
VLFAAALIALAGCGGGGGSAAAPSVPAAPAATPTPGGTSTLQSAHLTLTFPVGTASKSSSAHRKSIAAVKSAKSAVSPLFVDPVATTQLVTVINSINGNSTLPAAVQPFATTTTPLVTGGSGNCSLEANPPDYIVIETCTVSIPAPAGLVSYTLSAQDNSGNALSIATTSQTIASGTQNSFNVVLDGVVSSASFTAPTLTAGTASSGNLGLAFQDVDGVTITGSAPFSAGEIAVTSSSSHLTLSATQTGTYSTTITVNGGDAAAAVYYKYDGVAVANPTGVTIGVGTLVSERLNTTNSMPAFAGLTDAAASNGSAPGAVNYGAPTLIFDATGQTSTAVTASEVGFTPSTFGSGQLSIAITSPQPTGAGSDNGDGTYNAANCGAVVSELSIGAPDATAAGNETISATSGVAGICEVTVSDGLGDTSSFYISVTTASGTIDAKHRSTR